MNKEVRIGSQYEGEDRLSSLSDDLIHHILSFIGTRLAVQTSILSKRWKHIWTNLPVLTFDGYDQLFPFTHSGVIKFIDHVLSHRNHQLNVLSFKFVALYPIPRSLIEKSIEYPILSNVQDLDFDLLFHRHDPFKLSTFSSDSIQKLRLRVLLDFNKLLESDCCWDLPVLTTLHLLCPIYMSKYEVPESCLICLPALTTLRLDRCEFPKLASISLPALTTLTMARCKLPQEVWDFPALTTLELSDVFLPHNVSNLFSALNSLRNLTIMFRKDIVQDYNISCPQLVNLKISTSRSICSTPSHRIAVWAPNLCKVYCVSIFHVTLYVNELENADIKLWDTNEFNSLTMPKKKVFFRHLDRMFWVLGGAKILTIDSAIFKALSTHINFFKNISSPFYNLKYVMLTQGYNESSISTTLRKYLLSGSPGATIVTALPQEFENYQAMPTSLTSQTVTIDDPFATPTLTLVDSPEIQKRVCIETVEKRVVERMIEKYVVDGNGVRYVGNTVAGTGESDFLIWKDFGIISEFVGLLDFIMMKYPATFECFTAKSDRFHTMELNMLCTSVKEFLRTSIADFSTDIFTEFKDLFADLQREGFNVYWLASHLINYIDQLLFTQDGLHAIECGTWEL